MHEPVRLDRSRLLGFDRASAAMLSTKPAGSPAAALARNPTQAGASLSQAMVSDKPSPPGQPATLSGVERDARA